MQEVILHYHRDIAPERYAAASEIEAERLIYELLEGAEPGGCAYVVPANRYYLVYNDRVIRPVPIVPGTKKAGPAATEPAL